MTDTRDFALADILTMTTGRLLSSRHMEGVYDIANWMTGDNLMTHQIPRAADACGKALLAQHPQLTDVAPPDDIDAPDLMAWLSDTERQHGQHLPVAPLPPDAWEHRNPIEELCDKIGAEKVYAMPVPDGGEQR
ncbi:hypothetical protein [Streptomyces chartreusis]|uniref:DUF7736 domain-containing protein n=1 Tax=Streptomyces chartreusis TaxID=1969 RepID=UPI00123D0D65|nr:hypothetical protein [Streptomyces chartreusis]QEV66250.1 hypothetical protein CP983_05940 [Streptomyces chartreusis]